MPSLKVEIVTFQMEIILRKLTTLKDFIEKQNLVALIHGHPLVKIKLIYTIRYIPIDAT